MRPAPGAELVDSLLEASVVGSFARIGFLVRRRLFRWAPLEAFRLDGKVAAVTVNAVHPGWADTPGIRDALPTFSRALGPLLRTPDEGADTIVWLASAPEAGDPSGLFFLERRHRAKHRLGRTRRPDEAREPARLWQLCIERTALYEPAGAAP
jgi:hypothetical protein